MTSNYLVEVKAIDGYTTHSAHESYRDAVDQSDMVRGRVLCGTGMTDEDAWQYAAANQGFDGDFSAWQSQDDDEREAYEVGAGKEPPPIEGIAIQHDKSGVGHCWVAADNDNCPPSIAEEIAAEILAGKVDSTDDYVASNGCHYRW